MQLSLRSNPIVCQGIELQIDKKAGSTEKKAATGVHSFSRQ